jgi:CHAT domain-containing protein
MGIFNRFLLINRAKAFTLFFLGFFISSTCFSQEAKVNVEIRAAIENVKIGNYEKAIPVFKKNLNSKKHDEFTNLEIQIFLGFCNLVTKKGKVNVDYLNLATNDYFEKQGKFTQDSLTNRKEAEVYYFLAQTNLLVDQFEQASIFLLKVHEYYEIEKLSKDEIYTKILFQIGWSNYNLNNYEVAIKFCISALNVKKEIDGELNEFSLSNIYLIYESYKRLKYYGDAIFYLEKWLKIGVNLGLDDKVYLSRFSSLGVLYRENGDYFNSKEVFLKLIDSGKKILGENSIEYLRIQNNLGLAYSKLGNHKDALSVFSKLAESCKDILGEKHNFYLTVLNNLATTYGDLGEYQQSLQINQKVLDGTKENVGENHPSYLTSLSNQSFFYTRLGSHKLAFEISKKVVDISRDILGDNDPAYLTSLNNLASIHSDFGDFILASEIINKVIESRKEVLGENHPDYLLSLVDQSFYYSKLGHYKLALDSNQKALSKIKEKLGDLHPLYFIALNNQAQNFSSIGDLKSSLDINLIIVQQMKKHLGENHPDYFLILNNLADNYAEFGDYRQAIAINQKALDSIEKTLGENHPKYLTSLSNRAQYFSLLGDFKSSKDINWKVAFSRKDVLGENHPDYLLSLSNLASDFSNMGNFQTALDINEKVVESRRKSLGENHPRYLTSLSNKAFYLAQLKDYSSALQLAYKVLFVRKTLFDKYHPDYLNTLSDIAFWEVHSGNFSLGYEKYKDYVITLQGSMIQNLKSHGEDIRDKIWKKNSFNFNIYYSFFDNVFLTLPQENKKAYDISLFSKGILLNINRDFESLLSENGSPVTLEKYKELKLLKLQIQRLYDKPIGDRYLEGDSLENAAREIESELIKESKEYGDYTQNLKITWQEVQSNLGDNDVAIEFLEYPTLTDTVKYAALVLRMGWENPIFVPLFRKDQIDEIIKQGPNQIYSNGIVGKEIKKLVWDSLEEFMAPGDKVHFSAAGILHQLAIENLSYDESSTLGDRYQMYRLSSTKELALQKPQSKNQNVSLYGGIKYDLSLDQMIAGSEKFERKDSFLALRGIDQDSLTRKGWQFLPGTLAEANEVGQILRENQYQVTEFIGESGSEESLKNLSGKRTGIIHIATHGFFLPVEQSKRNPFIQMRFDGRNANAGYVDPMLRSGLLLAGGNRAWQGDSIPDTIEDGVLTSKEISNLDLRGTDLVVLSACETGLGDVSSEGVFGLQRAFKQAGAQTIIMSLWNVKDEATRYLMTNFYSYLTKGLSKREAFIQARNKCREKYQDPASWAAFIMLD